MIINAKLNINMIIKVKVQRLIVAFVSPDDGVGGHGRDKGPSGLFEALTRLLSEFFLEVVEKIRVDFATDLISGFCIRYAFDNATLMKTMDKHISQTQNVQHQ